MGLLKFSNWGKIDFHGTGTSPKKYFGIFPKSEFDEHKENNGQFQDDSFRNKTEAASVICILFIQCLNSLHFEKSDLYPIFKCICFPKCRTLVITLCVCVWGVSLAARPSNHYVDKNSFGRLTKSFLSLFLFCPSKKEQRSNFCFFFLFLMVSEFFLLLVPGEIMECTWSSLATCFFFFFLYLF